MNSLITLRIGTKGPIVPWTSVKECRLKSSRHKIVRHVLKPILRKHIGIDGLGWIANIGLLRPADIGRSLVVDVLVEYASNWSIHAVVED